MAYRFGKLGHFVDAFHRWRCSRSSSLLLPPLLLMLTLVSVSLFLFLLLRLTITPCGLRRCRDCDCFLSISFVEEISVAILLRLPISFVVFG